MECTGTNTNDDGKPIYPRWDAKTNSLLKLDYEEYGYKTLRRYIELFFSDQVESVANFTSKLNKAGYGYSVFHGMIPKMILFKGEPKLPCIHCGRRSGHSPSCPITAEIVKSINHKETEKVIIREELQDISLTAIFNDKIRGDSI